MQHPLINYMPDVLLEAFEVSFKPAFQELYIFDIQHKTNSLLLDSMHLDYVRIGRQQP